MGRKNFQFFYPKKVLSDKTAKVQVTMGFSFTGHSGGFGGPPDLCKPCLLDLASEMKKRVDGDL